MKITVLGATGLIGSRVVTLLRAAGHEVTPAARSAGVDAVTGKGLDGGALAGATWSSTSRMRRRWTPNLS